MSIKTAIITGVNGQDGAYLAKLLLDKGYRVIGAIRSHRCLNGFNFYYLGIENKIVFEEIDLTDMANVIRLIMKYSPDEIYNLAAQSSVGLSYDQPIGTFSFNTLSVNNLLESIRLYQPEVKFYQASSGEMYGNIKNLPVTVESQMNPISPYGVSKMASYFMVTTYRESYGLHASNGILFNHESFLRSDNFFVKKVIKESLYIKEGKKKTLTLGNIDIKRDFGYAPYYVEAMWRMLQMDQGSDYIISSGKSISLRSIVYHVLDRLGLDREIIVIDESLIRPNEISDIYGDNSKAKKELGWSYDYSFYTILDMLIDEEIRFYNKNGVI